MAPFSKARRHKSSIDVGLLVPYFSLYQYLVNKSIMPIGAKGMLSGNLIRLRVIKLPLCPLHFLTTKTLLSEGLTEVQGSDADHPPDKRSGRCTDVRRNLRHEACCPACRTCRADYPSFPPKSASSNPNRISLPHTTRGRLMTEGFSTAN